MAPVPADVVTAIIHGIHHYVCNDDLDDEEAVYAGICTMVRQNGECDAALLTACCTDDGFLPIVQWAAERGEPITPGLLPPAVVNGAYLTVEYLLGRGVEPTPQILFTACTTGNAPICRLLIDAGVDVNAPVSTISGRSTNIITFVACINTAWRGSLIRMLIEAGADPHAVDERGKSAFDYLDDHSLLVKK